MSTNIDGSEDITDLSYISDMEQERERLRRLNRERVRRYRRRHRKGATDSGSVSEANSRRRIADKAKPRASYRNSPSSQQLSQQAFFLLILLSIIFLLVLVAILRRKTPMSPFGNQDGMSSEY
jgi:hypothetical protein